RCAYCVHLPVVPGCEAPHRGVASARGRVRKRQRGWTVTEMVEARDVRVGDVLVLDADTTATVRDRDENARWSTVGLAVVRDKGGRTTLWLPNNALLSVKRKPRKWRRTVVL